jgi:hypothetical protein
MDATYTLGTARILAGVATCSVAIKSFGLCGVELSNLSRLRQVQDNLRRSEASRQEEKSKNLQFGLYPESQSSKKISLTFTQSTRRNIDPRACPS